MISGLVGSGSDSKIYEVVVAGRMVSWRYKSGCVFMTIKDHEGGRLEIMQFMNCKKEETERAYGHIK